MDSDSERSDPPSVSTMPTLHRQLLIENIGRETSVDDLLKCFHPALKQCGVGKNRPQIQLAVDKKGRSQGYASVMIPVSKVELFLNFDGWYVHNYQMKVSLVEARDVSSKWQSTKKGVFATSPTRAAVLHKPSHNYSLIDGGVYLTHPSFKTPDDVIMLAGRCGVEKLVTFGTSVHHSQEGLKLCRLFSGTLFCTAGVNPRNALYWTDEMERQLEEIANCPECVAIGVCGFDLSTDELVTMCDQQLQAFEKQVQLACRLAKPVVVTDNKASAEVMAILTKYKDQLTRVAIIGRPIEQDTFTQYLEQGFYYFISGDILKSNPYSELRRVLKDGKQVAYLNQFLLASQAPKKLFPQSVVGKEGTGYLPLVAEEVAECMEMDPKEVVKKLKNNAETFYGLVMRSCDGECRSCDVKGECRSCDVKGECDRCDPSNSAEADGLQWKLSEKEDSDASQGVGERDSLEEGESKSSEGDSPLAEADSDNKTDESANTPHRDQSSYIEETSNNLEKRDEPNQHLTEADNILKDRTDENIMESSFTTEHKTVASDELSSGADVKSESDDSANPGQQAVNPEKKIDLQTSWTYRIVLWLAFITGLLAMYFYDQ